MATPLSLTAALPAALLLFLAGCAGAAGRAAPPLKPGTTKLAGPLPSHRCAAGSPTCACAERGATGDAARETTAPAAGHYRLELSIYNTVRNEAELVVGSLDHVFRPTGESLRPDCWYVDLAPGIYPVRYRIAPADGLEVTLGLRIRRYAELPGDGGPEPLWYEVLDLGCGEGRGSECERDEIRSWFDRARAKPGRVTDPCSNVGIRALHWDAIVSPMNESLDQVEVRFELVVMNPPPDKRPCLER